MLVVCREALVLDMTNDLFGMTTRDLNEHKKAFRNMSVVFRRKL